LSWFPGVVFAAKDYLREIGTTYGAIIGLRKNEDIFLRGTIKLDLFLASEQGVGIYYWLHCFHLATPLCHMAIPLSNQSYYFKISAAFTSMQGSLILVIISICLSLLAMVRNLKCLQRMQILKYTHEYKFPMGFNVHIVYILDIFSCWQCGLSINPLRTWLHWKEDYT